MRRFLHLFVASLLTALACPGAAEAQAEKKDAFGDPLPPGAIARIGTTRYRLAGGRDEVLLSPDGKLMASINGNGDIDIHELPAWKKRPTIQALSLMQGKHEPPAFAKLVFSPDSKQLACYDRANQLILIIELTTGKSRQRIALPKNPDWAVKSLEFSHDRQNFVCSGWSQQKDIGLFHVLVWGLVKDKQKKRFEVPLDDIQPANFIGLQTPSALSPDGRHSVLNYLHLARSGLIRSSLELWDLDTGKSVAKITTEKPLRTIFSPDGKRLIATDDHSFLRVYETASGKELYNLRLLLSDHICLAVAPDGHSFYASEEDGAKISQWDLPSGKRIASYTSPLSARLLRQMASGPQFAFSPQGQLLALATNGHAFYYWEVKTGRSFSPTGMPDSEISAVQFSPRGELFVAFQDGRASWWNPCSGARLRDQGGLEHPRIFPVRAKIEGAAMILAADSGLLAVRYDRGLGMLDVKTCQLLYNDYLPYTEHRFFDDGAKAASIHDQKIRIWNSRTGRDLAQFEVPLKEKEIVIGFAISPNGKQFAITALEDVDYYIKRVVLWDADRKNIVRGV